MSESLTKIKAREINETIRYTLWSAFSIESTESDNSASGAQAELDELIADWRNQDIHIRGMYDVSGFRADSDFLFWIHAASAELVQKAIQQLLRTEFGKRSKKVWSAAGIHRPAEFNKGHVPAFMTGAEPKNWLVVYPFVRSFDWYLLPEDERREMLVEHGMAGRGYPGIISNTVSAFALGDYEWILALESDELHELVDMMRELRNTKARLHVREEIPFYTGHLIGTHELGEMFQ